MSHPTNLVVLRRVRYTLLSCVKKSRVHYDRKNRLGQNVYLGFFYYELEPFILNGLDNLEPSMLVFNGKLYSANIFHPITEKLRVMYHDLSLGFETDTVSGLPQPKKKVKEVHRNHWNLK